MTEIDEQVTQNILEAYQKGKEQREKNKEDKKKEQEEAKRKTTTTTTINKQQAETDTSADGLSNITGNTRLNPPVIFSGKRGGTYGYNVPKENTDIERTAYIFRAQFYTQDGEYDATYVLGRKDFELGDDGKYTATGIARVKSFNNALLNFETSNDTQQDTPTATITLAGFCDWEQVLVANDYVALTVRVVNYDDPSKSSDGYINLMSGLIADIKMQQSVANGRIYTITCQGVQKILNNVTLALPTIAQTHSAFLIFDINGNSNPAYEDFTASSDSDDNGDDDGGDTTYDGDTVNLPKTILKRAVVVAKIIKSQYPKATLVGMAGILGNFAQEGGISPSAINSRDHGSGLGQWTYGRETNLRNYAKKKGKKWNDAALQIDFALHEGGGDGQKFKKVAAMDGTPTETADEFLKIWERGWNNPYAYRNKRVAWAKDIYPLLKKKL